MMPDHDVLQRSHMAKHLEILERARQAAVRKLFRIAAGDILAAKAHVPGIRRVEPRDGVEQRGLACAVRADDGKNAPRRNLEADAVERAHAPERNRKIRYR